MIQAAFLLAAASLALYFYGNVSQEMRRLGLTFDYRFLRHTAGFAISEGIAYQPGDTYARAIWVGLVNTVRVTLLSIASATGIGVAMGVARLSSNWLVRQLAAVYVEVFRNIPLLLQLLFWYSGVILKLPPVHRSVEWFGAFFLSQRGLYMPRLAAGAGFSSFRWYCLAAVLASLGAYALARARLKKLDRPGFPSLWAAAAAAAVAACGWLLGRSPPLALEYPVLGRFNFTGGSHASPEFAGMLLGLSVYTGAFIAEVVRGGIQAVDKGQYEAARAVGLRPWLVMYLVILPQALRAMIPPLTNQYLNLAKNSSLAVAIGYPELFNVGTTAMNQTGQTLPVFVLMVAVYLALSLVTSALMNWYNRRTVLRG